MRASIHLSLAAALGSLLMASIRMSTPVEADPIAPGEEHCVVNVRTDDVLNIRSRPTHTARVEARKRHNECGIRVNAPCRGNWCRVEDGHSLGWAHRHFLAMVSPAMYCVTGVAQGDTLNLRAYPSPKSLVLTKLGRHQCDIAFLPYSVGSWQKVRVRGWAGWVNRRYLSGE